MSWQEYFDYHCKGVSNIQEINKSELPKHERICLNAFKGKYNGEDCLIAVLDEAPPYCLIEDVSILIYIGDKIERFSTTERD